jgi:hypothetical protein
MPVLGRMSSLSKISSPPSGNEGDAIKKEKKSRRTIRRGFAVF